MTRIQCIRVVIFVFHFVYYVHLLFIISNRNARTIWIQSRAKLNSTLATKHWNFYRKSKRTLQCLCVPKSVCVCCQCVSASEWNSVCRIEVGVEAIYIHRNITLHSSFIVHHESISILQVIYDYVYDYDTHNKHLIKIFTFHSFRNSLSVFRCVPNVYVSVSCMFSNSPCRFTHVEFTYIAHTNTIWTFRITWNIRYDNSINIQNSNALA